MKQKIVQIKGLRLAVVPDISNEDGTVTSCSRCVFNGGPHGCMMSGLAEERAGIEPCFSGEHHYEEAAS